MHQLRHRVFVEQLQWPTDGPIMAVDGMEYDQFDNADARYVVRINDAGEVDACARLLPTTGHYLLAEVYPELLGAHPIPRADDVWEISRLAADNTTAPRNILGQLIAVMLEYGLEQGLRNYVSVSDIRIEPLSRRAGWEITRLGPTTDTGTDTAAAEIYRVSHEDLAAVRQKSRIRCALMMHRPVPVETRTTSLEQSSYEYE